MVSFWNAFSWTTGVHQQCFCKVSLKKDIPHQQYCVKTWDRMWKPFKSQVQYRTRLKYKNLSFFSDKACFPLSRNVTCLTDTDGMDIPMMQFMKFLYVTFQLSVEYSECTHIHRAYISHHHLPFKGQAFGLFCLHNAHLFLRCPTSLLPWDYIWRWSLGPVIQSFLENVLPNIFCSYQYFQL